MGRILVAAVIPRWAGESACALSGPQSIIPTSQIPLVAFTAQCYFGRRGYILLGRPKWFLWLVTVWAGITALCGIA
jgi:hypothetical protein